MTRRLLSAALVLLMSLMALHGCAQRRPASSRVDEYTASRLLLYQDGDDKVRRRSVVCFLQYTTIGEKPTRFVASSVGKTDSLVLDVGPLLTTNQASDGAVQLLYVALLGGAACQLTVTVDKRGVRSFGLTDGTKVVVFLLKDDTPTYFTDYRSL